jgi:hypothetical protein
VGAHGAAAGPISAHGGVLVVGSEARGKHAGRRRGCRSERKELVRGEEGAILASGRPQLMVCAGVQLVGVRVAVDARVCGLLCCARERAAVAQWPGTAAAWRAGGPCRVAAAGSHSTVQRCRPRSA